MGLFYSEGVKLIQFGKAFIVVGTGQRQKPCALALPASALTYLATAWDG